MTADDWMSQAACYGLDPDLWFPEDCLEHALANNEHHGIWGGTSERERRRIRRIRARLAQAS
jgi:WhiB family redox-sensing transcriptional regulator